MRKGRFLIVLVCAVFFIILSLLIIVPGIIWLVLDAVLNVLSSLFNLFSAVITIPLFYQVEYWITYFSLLAAIFTLVGGLLWYPRARRRFASPIKRAEAPVARLILVTFVLIFLLQIFLTLFFPTILSQFSFYLFAISLSMVVVRNLVTLGLATLHWMKKSGRAVEPSGGKGSPLVSIVVPAYNEEKVIGKTIEALTGLTYQKKEIIVVDDGSKDKTLNIAKGYVKKSGISVLTKPNQGKWHALNTGISAAKGDVIICIDADTILDKEVIQHLVEHFNDPKVGAVAGNVKVGNRKGTLTKLQAIEYITSINLYRRSESYLNAVTVVPGPLGAFRREALKKAGFYEGDTFAEDADITLKILKAGYKTVYEPRSLGYTEAPSNLTDLAKQRYRWSRGKLQSLIKHRNLLLDPKYGFLGLSIIPWTIFNEIIYAWFMFFTLMWLLVLCFNPVSSFVIYHPSLRGPPNHGPPVWVERPGRPVVPGKPTPPPQFVIAIDFFRVIPFIYVIWFFFFLLLELVILTYALSIDSKEKIRLVLYIMPYKIVYALVIAVLGLLSQLEQVFNYPMKWEKASRHGTVLKEVNLKKHSP